MSQNKLVEVWVGLFLIVSFLAVCWLAFRLGEIPWFNQGKSYTLYAEFNNISGLKKGADLQISGVTIGTVNDLKLTADGTARVSLRINSDVHIPVDSIASIKSQGIVGDKFVQISFGGDSKSFAPEQTITDTESALDIESLVSKFAFGKVK